jgi:hypothetical protein
MFLHSIGFDLLVLRKCLEILGGASMSTRQANATKPTVMQICDSKSFDFTAQKIE